MTNKNDFITPPDARLFIQVGGTRPGQAYEYLGCGETQDTEISVGERKVVRRQSRDRRGVWDIVGQQYSMQDLHKTGVRMSMPRDAASFLERLAQTRCRVSIQVAIGKCNKPDEFNTGWDSKLLYEAATLSSLKIPGLASVDGEGNKTEELFIEGPLQFEYFDRITSMRFAERAGSTIVAEVLDGVYAHDVECSDCGPYSDGCDHVYVIAKANPGSPGLSGQLVYANDGVNFTSVDIPTLGGLSPNKIDIIGEYLVVISQDKRNLQYARRQAVLSASDWIAVSTGFVLGAGPRAIYAKSPGEVFFAGAIGYIYKATDYQVEVTPIEAGTLTSNNYNDIDGDGGDVVVAVGDSNVVVVSTNSGKTFSLLTGPSVGSDLNAVAVLDANNWIVGGDGGAFYRTNDGGLNWTAIGFKGAGVGAIVYDIEFCPQTPTVGYAAIEIGGRGYVFRTTDGGTKWFNEQPSVLGMTANAHLNFVAPCPTDINVAAAGGLASGSTDGFLVIGEGAVSTC